MLDQIAAIMAKRETLRVLRCELDDLEAERRAVRTRANLGLLGSKHARDAQERERRTAVHEEAKARLAGMAAEIHDLTAQVRALEGEIRRAEASLARSVSKPGPTRRT